ncbi:hypothetical protein ACOME3_006931 [Neoechinorhynchus agilis]
MAVIQNLVKGKCIVFFNTCHCTNYFSSLLQRLQTDKEVFVLHKKVRKRRANVFKRFMDSKSDSILTCTDLMSRGIDMPDVDWVIQFDLPTRLNAFIHRCGRTARMGRKGRALSLLMPNELAFVVFAQKSQRIPMEEISPLENVHDYTDQIVKLACQEREFHDSGRAAFVSFMQAYCSHECSLILRTKELDIGLLAQGYGLLELPKMKEIEVAKVKNFKPTDVDIDSIKYKDPVCEKHRVSKLKIQMKLNDIKSIKNEVRFVEQKSLNRP